jgi:hypothetical protein
MATSKATLKKVMAKRTRLKKAHPGWGASKLLKEAWKGNKAKTATKKRATKKVARKKSARRRTVSGRVGSTSKRRSTSTRKAPARKKVAGTMGQITSTARAARDKLKDDLGTQMSRQWCATTKTEKRKIAKQIAETKRKINSVNRIINKK